jgi:hypothetical protein
MGLLNFWKRKALEQPVPPYAGADSLNANLPSIDAGSFDGSSTFDGSSIEQFGGMQQSSQLNNRSNQNNQGLPPLDAQGLPPLDDQELRDGSKSISFNVPTFDFSLPPSDESAAGSLASMSSPTPMPSFSQFGLPLNDNPSTFMSPTSQTAITGADTGNIDVEDLNKLFISDEWKEPDWNTFDPYPEEKIEEPQSEDFKGAELPAFDDKSTESQSAAQSLDEEPVLEPNVPSTMEQSRSDQVPVELFIRGKAYNRVFVELDQMNKTLMQVDAQVGGYEDMLKREEPLLVTAKDQMECLYRKLNQVDKKIFAQ